MSPTTTPAIQVTDLVVIRSKRTVLKSVSAAIPAGAITGLLGPSGCGKSTFMRSVVGVQQVRSGRVTVLGEPAGNANLRRKIGYVTQAPSVYADLTVRDNVRYFASLYGLPHSGADKAIDGVGLNSHRDQLVANLSGGQRTRASLACALVAKPALLVLDEPTVGLDPVIRQDLWHQFHQLAASGVTLLVSSHVMDEAGRCDQLLLMRDGEFIAEDSPDAIRQRTGESDLEQAFLALIAGRETV